MQAPVFLLDRANSWRVLLFCQRVTWQKGGECMKYKVSFVVTDKYPTAEIEAKDRNEAIKLYQELWEQGKLAKEGVEKDARWSVISTWKTNAK